MSRLPFASLEKRKYHKVWRTACYTSTRDTLNRRATYHKMCISLPEFPTGVHFLDFAAYVNLWLLVGDGAKAINIFRWSCATSLAFSVARASFILVIMFFHKNNYYITSDIDPRNLIIFPKCYTLVWVFIATYWKISTRFHEKMKW